MRIIPKGFVIDKFSLRDRILRERFCRNYSWAIPSEKAIREIVEFANGETIVEVGAGKGYWARLIRSCGGSINCFDVKKVPLMYFEPVSFKEKKEDVLQGWDPEIETFYPVRFLTNSKEIEENIEGSRVLMFCWPEWGEPWAYRYLEKIRPSKVVYIGEWEGGCCADSLFFSTLHKEYEEIKKIEIPHWSCIHDAMWLFERKAS